MIENSVFFFLFFFSNSSPFSLVLKAKINDLLKVVDSIQSMHRRNQDKLPDMMSLAFQHMNINQVRKFNRFKINMLNSICLQRSRIITGYNHNFARKTPTDLNIIHNFLKQTIVFEGLTKELKPNNQTFVHLSLNTLQSLTNNEDRTVLMCWNPPIMDTAIDIAATTVAATTTAATTTAAATNTTNTTTKDDKNIQIDGWRSKELYCRHIRDMQTMMLVPQMLTWSFEKSSVKMKNVIQEMKESFEWYEREVNINMNDDKKTSITLDHKGCRHLLHIFNVIESMSTFLCTFTSKSTKEMISAHVNQLNKCTFNIQEYGHELNECMKMDNGTCLEPSSIGLLSRFVRIHSFAIGILLHTSYRLLPSDLLKVSKKKSKKSKKNKNGKGNNDKKHILDSIRKSIIDFGTALHDVLCSLKKTNKNLIPKDVSDMKKYMFSNLLKPLLNDEKSITLQNIITKQRQDYVSKQLLDDWCESYESIGEIIDDRVNLLLRLPGVGK
jgi:hypothetical protein